MTAHPILLQMKYARVIELYSRSYGVSLDTALDRFYKSQLYGLVSKGISDMHCMSDAYLAEELHDEWRNAHIPEE